MTDLERLRSLVEMDAALCERLHRSQEAAAFRRVLEMIDGLVPDKETMCRICGKGKVVDGVCDICGMKYVEEDVHGDETL